MSYLERVSTPTSGPGGYSESKGTSSPSDIRIKFSYKTTRSEKTTTSPNIPYLLVKE